MSLMMMMNLDLYSAKTIEEHSKALYLELKNIRHSPILILKIVYLNFTVV